MDADDAAVEPFTARYPIADITPAQFEQFVAETLSAGSRELERYTVKLHETLTGVDGKFDFDATVRYRLNGMDFLVVVEAKRYKNPIKRDVVQTLHSKMQSVGAHKGVLIATAHFQSGAVTFAKTHGIALVYVSEGRFTFETRGATPPPVMSREQAAAAYGLPIFTGVYIGPGDSEDSTVMATVGADSPDRVQEYLLGVPPEQ